jgi:hypothetical protein
LAHNPQTGDTKLTLCHEMILSLSFFVERDLASGARFSPGSERSAAGAIKTCKALLGQDLRASILVSPDWVALRRAVHLVPRDVERKR